ncbi:MFS transporter [Sulfurovum sp.]|jgi:predicted MFS family arabinose efflux permease|uniref:MFS transporter n=1 Tax=Sulfurovum sp. TaxID=1969726 RepID=UPI002A366A10|nr:MFS transporter [Sulfurovum sp.]MDD2451520.1 MFS transporter [Sulfurovum sp.]MDD3500141.1 MFS transporter [Sulfurovum sp.]MDY0402632.1 MFS transporter [Sulfurovum sp.]
MFKQVFPLSSIVALRFFGLFIVLPVLSVYALEMEGATAFLAGVVVGGYALTQALFQIPFGLMSDKLGRKKTLFFGLIIFIAGSVICALSDDIYTLMLGRFLQGAGAIGSVVSAMIADLVKEEQRAHAMAIMGGTIALSFAAAMIIAPIVGGNWGIDKLFWLTAILSVIAIGILFTAVPQPPKIVHSYEEEESKMLDVFKDKSLTRMYITFLFHSSIMTMAFFIIPLVMTQSLNEGGFGWEKSELWKVYLPAMIFGLLAMGPAAVFGEKYGKGRQVFMVSVATIFFGFIAMGYATVPWLFIVGVVLFFIGFNMFEPLLQSFVSKFAKVHQKGAALGVANTFAYVGIFLGGLLAGYVIDHYDRAALALIVAILSAMWFVWVMTMPNPNNRGNVYLPLDIFDREKVAALTKHEAIVESYINETENIAVVKYEKDLIDEDEVRGLLS